MTIISQLMILLNTAMPLMIFCLLDLFLRARCLCLHLFLLWSSITYFDALSLAAYTLRIIMSSRRIYPFLLYNALFILDNFTMKFSLSKINIDTPEFLWLVVAWSVFLHPFNLYASLYLWRFFVDDIWVLFFNPNWQSLSFHWYM